MMLILLTTQTLQRLILHFYFFINLPFPQNPNSAIMLVPFAILAVLLPFAASFNLYRGVSRYPLRVYHQVNQLESTDAPVQHFDKSLDFAAIEPDNEFNFGSVLSAVVVAAAFLHADPANAAASEYGILAGRTASLIHPFTNFALFATSIYSAYLGLQWRRLRDLSEEIKSLNSALPKLATTPAKFPINDLITSLNSEVAALKASAEADTSGKLALIQQDIAKLRGASDLDSKYVELTTTRKSLQSANLKDKHHTTGSILLGAGVMVSILGAFNTYMRAGKLFSGPHLYAGMAITILWALAAALVPAMQKGNEAARIAHISFNVVNILLFAWQIPTGIEIMLKVWEKTSW